MSEPVSNATLDAMIVEKEIAGDLVAGGTIDLKEVGLNQRDALICVADTAAVWRTDEGETYASFIRNGHTEHHHIRARAFTDWWLSTFARTFTFNGRPAAVGEGPVRDARQMLEARAYDENIRHDASLRVLEHAGRLYIDLGTDDWSCVEVDVDGWRIIAKAPVPIVRSRRTGALPIPAEIGSFAPLREILGRLNQTDFVLLTAWCLGSFLPAGPHPVLILGGEQGSGKSTQARLAQKLTDPVSGDLLQPPGDDRDLITAARHGRVLAFDNVSGLKPDLADSICRLATGAEIGGRALFTNHDSASFRACRPQVLNGIPDLAARGDLADRSIVIRLDALPSRVTERDFWREVEADVPTVFAAILDALAAGLRRQKEVSTPNVRMADFARFVVAAESALPWKAGEFLAAYAGNRQRIVTAIVEGDLVASKVAAFMSTDQDWSGLMSELYGLLSAEVPPDARRAGDWPGNARWFSDRLTRAAPALRALGIDIKTRQEARGTKADIRRIAPLEPLAPQTERHSTNTNGATGATGAIPLVSDTAPRLSSDEINFLAEMAVE